MDVTHHPIDGEILGLFTFSLTRSLTSQLVLAEIRLFIVCSIPSIPESIDILISRLVCGLIVFERVSQIPSNIFNHVHVVHQTLRNSIEHCAHLKRTP